MDKTQGRIDTLSLIKNNSYKNGGVISDNSYNSSSKMVVDPTMYDRYDFAMTDDIVLLNERKETNEILYNIFHDSSWGKKYMKDNEISKINKEDIHNVFYYCKNELLKNKNLSIFEMLIAINEFFDFNYNYIFKNVLSVKLKAELYNDLYKLGYMENKEDLEEQLF
jgi:hypothetical protein